MEFDINTLRGLATVACMVAFIGVVLWAYSEGKKDDFSEAAQLPFADETDPATQATLDNHRGGSNNDNKGAQHV